MIDKLAKLVISLCLVLGSGVALAEAFGSSGGGVSASLVCLLAGGADCQLPSVRGGTFAFQDTNGVVDVQISTAASGTAGGIVQLIDPRSTLAASACDALSETGQIVSYDDGASNSTSICVCEEIAGVIGWAAISPTGDCTP